MYMLSSECASLMADAEEGWDGIVDHFDSQNTVDIISIVYSMFYAIFRVVYPYGTYLNPNHYKCIDKTTEDCQKFI